MKKYLLETFKSKNLKRIQLSSGWFVFCFVRVFFCFVFVKSEKTQLKNKNAKLYLYSAQILYIWRLLKYVRYTNKYQHY